MVATQEKPLTILIVNKNDDERREIENHIHTTAKKQKVRIAVYKANTQTDALLKLKELSFDVVCTDMAIPLSRGVSPNDRAGITIILECLKLPVMPKIIVYSNFTISRARTIIDSVHIFNVGDKEYPKTITKSHFGNHREVAEAIIEVSRSKPSMEVQ